MKVSVLALVALLVLPASAYAARNPHYQFSDSRGRTVYIIDGDTVVVGKTKIRLLDIDTGEIEKGPHGYKCDAELQSGLQARDRLFQLLSPPNRFSMKYGKGKDLYGRNLARVYSNGKDAGKILASEGLAMPYDPRKGDAKPNHCPAPHAQHH
jgi:endonuclease YncB( thermonuclease family)